MGIFDQMSGAGRSYMPSGQAPVNMWGGGSGGAGGGMFSGMATTPFSMYAPPPGLSAIPMMPAAPTPPVVQAPQSAQDHAPPSLRDLLRQGPSAFANTDIPQDFLRLMMFAAY